MFKMDNSYLSKKLLSQLNIIKTSRLTLIEAPSGFGKTTSMRTYLNKEEFNEFNIYWYTSFGESHEKTWQQIYDIFKKIDIKAWGKFKHMGVPTRDTLSDISSIMMDINCEIETLFIIDNYQLIKNNIQKEIIGALSLNSCDKLHIIIITQKLEEKDLDSLCYFDYHIITADNFLFEEPDIKKYFKINNISLDKSQIKNIYDYSGGWISAIKLQMINYLNFGKFEYNQNLKTLIDHAIWSKLNYEEKNLLLSLCIFDGFSLNQISYMSEYEKLPPNINYLLRDNIFIRYYEEKQLYYLHSILQDYLKDYFYNFKSESFRKNTYEKAALFFKNKKDSFQAACYFQKIKNYDELLSLPIKVNDFPDNINSDVNKLIINTLDECPKNILKKYPNILITFGLQLFCYGIYSKFQEVIKIISNIIENPDNMDEKTYKKLKGEFIFLLSFTEYNDIRKMSEKHKIAYKLLDGKSELIIFTGPWTFGSPSILYMYWRDSGQLDNELIYMNECMPYYMKLTNNHGSGADITMEAEVLLMRGEDELAESLCYKGLYIVDDAKQISIYYCIQFILGKIALLRGDSFLLKKVIDDIKRPILIGNNQILKSTEDMIRAYIMLSIDKKEEIEPWLFNEKSISNYSYILGKPYVHIIYGKILLEEKRYNELIRISYIFIEESEKMHYLTTKLYNLIHISISYFYLKNYEKSVNTIEKVFEIALKDKVYFILSEYGYHIEKIINCKEFDKKKNERYVYDLNKILDLHKKLSTGIEKIKKDFDNDKSSLTKREREIALLAQRGITTKEISKRLFISTETVKMTLKKVYRKLDVHSKAELNTVKF